MSNNWGDFNGDGRTDYVDYKIFTTQVDPYSGEYQNDAYKVMQEYQRQQYQSQQKSLSFGQWFIWTLVAGVVLLVVMSLPVDSDLIMPIFGISIIVIFVVYIVIKNKQNKSK